MVTFSDTNLAGLTLFKKGKVRDVYDLGANLLIVATDRVSAFDIVLPTPIPDKGKILTRICEFWFDLTTHIIQNHKITTNISEFPIEAKKYKDKLAARSMLVKKATIIPVECVVRGWLAGSGLKEYRECGAVCGIKLPKGLREADKLPEPIFTPTTKATEGHDLPLTEAELQNLIGKQTAQWLKSKSIELYKFAVNYAAQRDIIIADTKFEFGRIENEIIIVDEIFTPDSSRYWPLKEYEPGRAQKSYDKQFVRDYLEQIGWNKKPPAPHIPPDIVTKTKEKYEQAEKLLIPSEIPTESVGTPIP
ncbi:MAG: phosphoribosylaminoimidazolesuccinocarboxamide synthase [Candidatus Stahlbacteria bacterium]|nr:phosphoribosylaminoimidazolesuccinocarboxamide synthase [Candidatus Stahlbacteria bacterium]